MMGLEFTGQPPFQTVYLHGLVRDDKGRKMSKTTGNVVDPRWIIDGVSGQALRTAGTSDEIAKQYPDGIAAMGTDALRFTLLTSGTPGNDLNLSLQRVEANRNFANKIWNMARFVLSNLPENFQRPADLGLETSDFGLPDRWILSRLNQVIADCTRLIEAYEFGAAGTLAHEFLWGEYADWYIEAAKVVLTGSDEHAKARTRAILVHVLDAMLRLLHPFVPFITEAVWQKLPRRPGDPQALIIASWPRPGPTDEAARSDFGHLMEIIRAIRNARAENKVEQNKKVTAFIAAGDKARWLGEQRAVLTALAKLDEASLKIETALPQKPRNAVALVIGGTEVYLPFEGLVNLGAEKDRLTKELSDLDKQISKSEGLLASDFAGKAPAAVTERERGKLAGLKESRGKVAARLDGMK
jgi:valyl-tRNA synthetase